MTASVVCNPVKYSQTEKDLHIIISYRPHPQLSYQQKQTNKTKQKHLSFFGPSFHAVVVVSE